MKRDFLRAFVAKGRDGEAMANPLFPAQKKPLWKKLMLGAVLLVVPIGGTGAGVTFLREPKFQIQNISVQGLTFLNEAKVRKVIDADLQEPFALVFTRKEKFLFQPDELKKRLVQSLPIKDAAVTVTGNELSVAITEDIVTVLVHSADHWLLMDLDGKIIRELSPEEVGHLGDGKDDDAFVNVPKMTLDEVIDPALAEAVVPASRLSALSKLDHNLRARQLTPVSYSLSTRKTTWVTVKTKEKAFVIYVDLDEDIDAQTSMLDAAQATYANDESSLNYIDLRFGNRVYVK